MGQPAHFFILILIYFRSFQTNIITIFTKKICEKYPSSIWCQDSNPRPSEHESPPKTTRLGFLPSYSNILIYKIATLLHWDAGFPDCFLIQLEYKCVSFVASQFQYFRGFICSWKKIESLEGSPNLMVKKETRNWNDVGLNPIWIWNGNLSQ